MQSRYICKVTNKASSRASAALQQAKLLQAGKIIKADMKERNFAEALAAGRKLDEERKAEEELKKLAELLLEAEASQQAAAAALEELEADMKADAACLQSAKVEFICRSSRLSKLQQAYKEISSKLEKY